MRAVFCLYDTQDAINGINTSLLRLLPELQRIGIQVQAQFILWAAEEKCTTLPLLQASGIDCRVVKAPYYTQDLIRSVLRAVHEYQPDVFVPGNVIPALYAAKWARRASIATVGMLHNDDIEYRSIRDEFVFSRPDFHLSAIVCVSQKLESEVISMNPPSTIIRRIPYIAPLPETTTSFNPPHLRMIYCGRIAETQKRISLVAKAMCEAAAKLPNVHGSIYGSGPEEQLLDNILKQYGSGAVKAHGRVSPDAMLQEWLSSHVCVLLSEYEGLPVSLLEAMAHGVVPICSSMQSGIPELIEDNESGLLVNSIEEFVVAVQRLQDEPGLWHRLSNQARERIKRDYSTKTIVAQWQKLFQELGSTPAHKNVRVPHILTLPPPKPVFAEQDRRKPWLPVRAARKLRQIFSEILNNPVSKLS